jgi:DNA ligase D-like protein (predicted 3'-phosphoesterase)
VAKRTPTETGQAIRATARPEAETLGPALRDAVIRRAGELGLTGWARDDASDGVRVHAEGAADAVAELVSFLLTGSPAARVAAVRTEPVAVEGHERFGARGVSAGVFVVQEHQARAHHFDLRLEVGGVMRSWALPKGPSLDPAVKRLAVEVEDHSKAHNTYEGAGHGGGVIVWDQGTYEQGGRVAWPEALQRGHAVFVLHGAKLRGGFALQRTRPAEPPQWLLIKRRDDEARPGSDIATESPRSVLSGRTLDEIRR